MLTLFLANEVRGQGSWSIDTSTGFVPRRSFSANALNGKIYVIGGVGGDTIQVFDPSTQIWSTPATTGPFTWPAYHAASVVNGKIYITGEEVATGRDSVLIFDPSTNVWSQPQTSGTFTWRQDLTSAVVGNKIYAMGGQGNINGHDTVLNTLEVFDPSSNSWSTPIATGRFTARKGLTSSVVNDKIYVIGGDTGLGPCNFLEVFDPSTNSWSTPKTTGTFTAREYTTSSVVDSKIYVIGGYPGDGGFVASNLLEIFDPATNTWAEGQRMPTCRMQLSSAVVDGKIYALGGYTPHEELNTVEVFTPNTSSVQSVVSTNSFFIWPTIASSKVEIAMNESEIANEYLLSDEFGRTAIQQKLVGETSHFEIATSDLPSGLYIVRVLTNSCERDARIIVKH